MDQKLPLAPKVPLKEGKPLTRGGKTAELPGPATKPIAIRMVAQEVVKQGDFSVRLPNWKDGTLSRASKLLFVGKIVGPDHGRQH